MNPLLKAIFSKKPVGSSFRRRRGNRAEHRSRLVEQLEQRLAMAIEVFRQDGAPWAVITSDNADDVYIQQVATDAQNLFVADNASFNFNSNFRSVVGIDGLATIYATNGTAMVVGNVLPDGQGASTTTSFVLDRGDINTGALVSGELSYAGNVWQFTNGGNGNALTFTLQSSGGISNPALVRPRSGNIAAGNGADELRVIWWDPPAVTDTIGGPTLTVTFVAAGSSVTLSNIPVAAGVRPSFSLPVTPTNPGGIVPGTVGGSIVVAGYGLDFRANNLFAGLNGPNSVPLYFYNRNGVAAGTTGSVVINEGAPTQRTQTVTGSINYTTGIINLEFKSGSDLQNPGPVVVGAGYATFNQDAQSSEFSLTPGQDFSRELFTELLTPGSSINIESPILQNSGLGAGTSLGGNGVTFNATNINVDAQVRSVNYFDVQVNHGVQFLAPRATIVSTASARAIVGSAGTVTAIAVPAGGGGQGYDDDPANAPRVTFATPSGGSAATGYGIVRNGVVVAWVVDNPGSGYTSIPAATVDPPPTTDAFGDPRLPVLSAPVPELISFDAAVAARSYSMYMGDDPSTEAVDRGRLFVSPTGSLSGALAATAAGATTASNSVFVLANTADVVVEGTIFADIQSYLLQSPPAAQGLAPFLMTTASPSTGAQTGLIRGKSVAVTMGNDLPTPEQGAAAVNTVNLRTQVESLRVRAATQAGAPLNGPFPYDLTIDEVDDVSFDAVAASSRPISLSAAGNIAFTASLATAGDLAIRATKDFAVSAPVSTSRGRIEISGANLAVNNSLRVLDPAVDEFLDDIVLNATSGDLNLTGTISAVNNVRLVQTNKAGTSGKLGGSTRVTARAVDVTAQGSVDLRTNVTTLKGTSGGSFSLDETDDISITSLRALGRVTLRAGGVDPGLDNESTPNTIALKANLTDVVTLEASAPRGSIDIVSNSTKTLVLGNAIDINTGKAASMQAAGNVSIRSLVGPVTVADAPLAGGSAMPVRVATTANLAATFAYNTPGTFASTLTNSGPRTALSIDGLALRVGDRVLVKNQAASQQNGVYVVTRLGNATTDWLLTRAADADTTAEIPAATLIKVAEGTAAGRVFTTGYTPAPNVSPIIVTSVANRADAVRARTATTASLPGVYNSVATTITAASNGTLPAIDGVALNVGDRVIVRLGAAVGGQAANGVYEVTNLGGVAGRWVLTRALDPDTGNPFTEGYAATTEGTFRASATGQAFRIAYDSLGNDPMQVTQVAGTGRPMLNIGTDSVTSTTTFVVSSAAGTNDAAGSLGKMIQIRQANDNSSSAINPMPLTDFRFASFLAGLNGAPAGTIRLAQELPLITTPLAINGTPRLALPGVTGASTPIVVDGSRITTTRSGQPATALAEVNGFEFGSGSGAAAGRPGASLTGITVGGFDRGAAVKVVNAPGILLNGVTLGRDGAGQRLANNFGVLTQGNTLGTTILASTIVSSTTAGLRVVSSGLAGVTVVGSTFGAVNQNNGSGIEIFDGTSQIGVNPIAPGVVIRGQTTLRSDQMQLPANVPASAVFLGQSIVGTGIPVGTVVAAINGTTLTLSNRMTATGVNTLTLGRPNRNVVQHNLTGMVLAGGRNTITNTNVNNNVRDGIQIRDTYDTVTRRFSGSTQLVGLSVSADSNSNAVFANGNWGINIVITNRATGVQMTPNPFNLPHLIRGNFFGSAAGSTAGVANTLGNVGVNSALAPVALGFNPTIAANTVTATDRWGNRYARPTGGSGGSAINQPWRPR